MKRRIDRVAVLGAGTMGSAIAAHFANAGVPALLLDIVPPDPDSEEERRRLDRTSTAFRNRLAGEALGRLLRTRPAPLFLPELVRYIAPGNLEDDLRRIAEADWVIEAVVEDPRVKIPLLRKVDELRRPGSIVSTNTSGIPVNLLARDLSADFRRHWLGTHFFNPPRYLKLVELIPGTETDPQVVDDVAAFLDRELGKGVVKAKDTPNFIANRIGLFNLMYTLRTMLESGWGVDEVDALTGPLMGRPKSATFRTVDLVGVDTLCLVIRHIQQSLPHDEAREVYTVPPLLEEMVKRGWLGTKSGLGFYRKAKQDGKTVFMVLDWRKMEHLPPGKLPAGLARLREGGDLPARLRLALSRTDRVSSLAWQLLRGLLLYSARRIPEISDDIPSVDRALRWGFGWKLGPFELWDAMGVKRVTRRLEKEGQELPPLVERLLASGRRSFYQSRRGRLRVFDVSSEGWQALPPAPGVIDLGEVRGAGRIIRQNKAATLLDLGDGVACLEFHTKMNVIGRDTISMLRESLEVVEGDFAGVLVANQGEDFSAGANLQELLVAAREGEWDEIERLVRAFQDVNMSLRSSRRPVVVAPFGLTLGGGCEMALAADCVHAGAETYMGLVEVGVGLIPAGGGTKEVLRRHLDRLRVGLTDPRKLERGDAPTVDPVSDPFPLLETAFATVGQARVSAGAAEARRLLFLRESDPITMNGDRLVAEAAETVRALARIGYRPPLARDDIPALGEPALARLRLGLHLLERGGRISAHDRLVGSRLARVLTGGARPRMTFVSEQEILDLEREAFLSLVGETKTQERMEHTLRTGKPLRN